MRITQLPTGSVASTDYVAADNTTNGTRKLPIRLVVPIHKSGSLSSLPTTVSDSNITANHRVTDMKITGATTSFVLAWTTAAGSVTFSLSYGTFSACSIDYNLEVTE